MYVITCDLLLCSTIRIIRNPCRNPRSEASSRGRTSLEPYDFHMSATGPEIHDAPVVFIITGVKNTITVHVFFKNVLIIKYPNS